MPVRLAELAVRFGCELRGDPDALVERVAPLAEATPGSVAFLANPRYRRFLAGTRATAVVLDPVTAEQCPVSALVSRNPPMRGSHNSSIRSRRWRPVSTPRRLSRPARR
jgi:UDP-3-O-[3-hydroxymyristoyl] glucosamine N-acyltransferase